MNNFIEDFIKCVKDKCKEKNDKVIKDKKLVELKTKLNKENNIKKKEKIIRQVYSNPIQRDLDLCAYKSCKIVKKLQKLRLKTFKDKIKLYDIKLSPDLQLKFKRYEELVSKTSMNDDEYLEYVILFQIIHEFINDKMIFIKAPLMKYLVDYMNCSNKNCKDLNEDVRKDEELMKKKISIFSMKDNKKRNDMIREVYSNENQVKLDKCIAKKCNKPNLKLVQEYIKLLNKKIDMFNIKIPDNIKLPNINKITEEDIPELVIKFNQFSRYVNKDIYIGNL